MGVSSLLRGAAAKKRAPPPLQERVQIPVYVLQTSSLSEEEAGLCMRRRHTEMFSEFLEEGSSLRSCGGHAVVVTQGFVRSFCFFLKMGCAGDVPGIVADGRVVVGGGHHISPGRAAGTCLGRDER